MEIYKLDIACREYEYEWYYVGPVGLETAREQIARFKENEFARFISLYKCDITYDGEIYPNHNLEYLELSNKKKGE